MIYKKENKCKYYNFQRPKTRRKIKPKIKPSPIISTKNCKIISSKYIYQCLKIIRKNNPIKATGSKKVKKKSAKRVTKVDEIKIESHII